MRNCFQSSLRGALLSAEAPPSGEGGCDEAIQLFVFLASKMDCFAEPVIGRRFAPTRWLAMTACLGCLKFNPHALSSPRKRGPITTVVCWSKSRQPLCLKRGRGVWVPACAGTTVASRSLSSGAHSHDPL